MEQDMGFEELQEIVSVCLDEILELKQENQRLKEKEEYLSGALRQLLESNKGLLENVRRARDDFELNMRALNIGLENLKYEWNDPYRGKELLQYPRFYRIEETIKEIVQDRKSMARFGDGEFSLMAGSCRQRFQRMDEKLAARLREVISVEDDNFLIGIADNYGSLEAYNMGARRDIRAYMTREVRKEQLKFLDLDRIYHNAYISRPYALFADNQTEAPAGRFMDLKRIWDDRNVIFVEGALTRLGVGNNLFDNARKIGRIEAPPENSFDKYKEILESALRYAEKDTLFLIALGPAAGVLAYDLYRAGYQALDIGHLDLEYEWFLKGTGGRCEIKHKYNNEYQGGENVEPVEDAEYLKEILCQIP